MLPGDKLKAEADTVAPNEMAARALAGRSADHLGICFRNPLTTLACGVDGASFCPILAVMTPARTTRAVIAIAILRVSRAWGSWCTKFILNFPAVRCTACFKTN